MTEEELVEGFIHMTDETYKMGKIIIRLFGDGIRAWPRFSATHRKKTGRRPHLLQKFSAFTLNLAYREVYRGQKELFKERIHQT